MTETKNIFISISEIILGILLIIITLIYVEIISINICNLNKDQKNEITNKSIADINQSNYYSVDNEDLTGSYEDTNVLPQQVEKNKKK